MNSKEIVLAALKHTVPERVPWCDVGIDFDVTEGLLGRPSYYRARFFEQKAYWDGKRDEVVASIQKDIEELILMLGLDVVPAVMVPSIRNMPKPLKEIGNGFYEDDKGNIYKLSVVTHTLDIYEVKPDAYKIPDESELRSKIEYIRKNGIEKPDESEFEVINYLVDRFGDSHFVVVRAPDVPLSSLGISFEQKLLNAALYPELTALAAELVGLQVEGLLTYYADAGLNGIVISEDYGSCIGPIMSPRYMNDVIFPPVKRICDKAKALGLKVIKHSCGNNGELVGEFSGVGIDAYQSIQVSAGVNIQDVKREYGKELCLIGGVNVETLTEGTPDEVWAEVKEAFETLTYGGGYMIGASQTICSGCKVKNVLAMKKAIEHFNGRK